MSELVVSSGTVVCVEGFPRSGNSYARILLCHALDLSRDMVASHTHSVANVARALGCKLPTYVMVREPFDCCASLVMTGYCDTLEEALQAYRDFYTSVLPLQNRVTFVPFQVLTGEPKLFVASVAEDLGKSSPRSLDSAIALAISDLTGWTQKRDPDNPLRSTLPNDEKRRMKQVLNARLTDTQKTILADCKKIEQTIMTSTSVLAGSQPAGA